MRGSSTHRQQVFGSLLWLDIEGFSRITERLFAREGDRAAETLHRILKQGFSPQIQAFQEAGFVPRSLIGDGILAVRYGPDDVVPALHLELSVPELDDPLRFKALLLRGSWWERPPRPPFSHWLMLGGAATALLHHEKQVLAGKELKVVNLEVPDDRIPTWATGPPVHPQSEGGILVPAHFRVVSALFLHVRLAQDPPDLEEVDALSRQIQNVATRYGGHLVRVDPDPDGIRFFVIFGLPPSPENPPDRALTFLESLQREALWDQRFRGALSTGRVFLTTFPEWQAWLRGAPVMIGPSLNRAAHLAREAPPGILRVDETTRDWVGDQIQVERDGGGWRWVSYHARPPLHLPFVGRQEVWEALDSGNSEEGPRIFFLLGDAGYGKTRLLEEWAQRLRHRDPGTPVYMERFQEGEPVFSALIRLLARVEGVGPEDLGRRIRERLEQGGRRVDPEPLLQFLLAHEGRDFRAYEQVMQHIRYAFFTLLNRIPSERWGWILIDDLHHARPSEILLLQEWVAFAHLPAGNRLRLVMAARSESRVLDQMPRHAEEELWIELGPLRIQDLRELLTRLTGDPHIPERVVTLLHQKSQGIPFYLEQYLRYLMHRHWLVAPGGRWVLRETLEEEPLPLEIWVVMQALLDRLPAETLTLLQWMSVVGLQVSEDLLKDLAGGPIDALLAPARRAGVVLRTAPGVYALQHDLVRETLYRSMPEGQRVASHRQVADLLNQRPDRSAYLDVIAEHYARGGDRARAVQVAREFAAHARALFRFAEAEHMLQKAQQWLEEAEDRSWMTVAFERMDLLHQMSRFHEEGQLLERLEPHLESLRRCERHEWAVRAARLALLHGYADRAWSLLEGPLMDTGADDPHRLSVLRLQGNAYFIQGRLDAAFQIYEEGFQTALQQGNEEAQAAFLQNLGVVFERRRNPAQALRYYALAHEIWARLPNPFREARIMHNMALVYARMGEYARARTLYEQSLRIKQEIGDRFGEAMTLLNLAHLAFQHRDLDRALDLAREAGMIWKELNVEHHMDAVEDTLGLIALEYGDLARAERHFQKALTLRVRRGTVRDQADSLLHLGVLRRVQGRYFEAESFFREALARYREVGLDRGQALVAFHRGLMHQLQEQPAPARTLLLEALRIYEDIGEPLPIAETTLLLADVEWALGWPDRALQRLDHLRFWLDRLPDVHRLLVLVFHQALLKTQGRELRARQLEAEMAALRSEISETRLEFLRRSLLPHRTLRIA